MERIAASLIQRRKATDDYSAAPSSWELASWELASWELASWELASPFA